MDPALATIAVAVISLVAGSASGLVVSFARPFGEDWVAKKAEKRKERTESFKMLSDETRKPRGDRQLVRTLASQIGDDALIAHVGRWSTAPSEQGRQDALGDISFRIGELMR